MEKTVVIDTGSYEIKAGFACDKKPSFVFGNPNRPLVLKDFVNLHVGQEEIQGSLKVSELFLKQATQIWEDIYRNKISIESEKQPVIVADSAFIPKVQREKTATIMFEKFNVPLLLNAGQSALAVYGSGLDHGCVLNVGANYTECVPIFEPDNRIYGVDARRTAVGGNDVMKYLAILLAERGKGSVSIPVGWSTVTKFNDTARFLAELLAAGGKGLNPNAADTVEKLNYIKENCGRVAANYAKETANALVRTCNLPDGTAVELGPEALACTELLFRPTLGGIVDEQGVSDTLFYTLQNARSNSRLREVVLTGGGVLFPGFRERIAKELKEGKPLKIFSNTVVSTPTDPRVLTWVGGAIVASMKTFQSSFVTKAEYNEHGPAIVHKKWLM